MAKLSRSLPGAWLIFPMTNAFAQRSSASKSKCEAGLVRSLRLGNLRPKLSLTVDCSVCSGNINCETYYRTMTPLLQYSLDCSVNGFASARWIFV